MFEYIIGLLAFLRAYHHFKIFRIKRRNYEHYPIMKGGRPFLYKRGHIGILLVHGFTSTPQEMRSLGQYLAKRDITVYCPLLKYHGTVVEDLVKGKLPVWNEQIIREMEFLKKHCEQVYIGGNSFGGNLAFLYASSHRVQGIVSFGTPIFWKRERIYKYVYYLLKQFKVFQKKKYPSQRDRVDPRVIKKKVHYPKIPLPAASEVIKSASWTKKILEHIKDPLIIIQSTADHIVDKRTPGYIYDNVASTKKRLIWINDSYHVVLVDKYKEKVFEETYSFIKETKNRKV